MKVRTLELIIRPNADIKSRQWWRQQSRKLRRLFLKYLPDKKIRLFKTSSLTLLITNNKEIQDLNRKFRRLDKPTDVLSFHLSKKEQIKKKYLGDIVISLQAAKVQARRKGHTLRKELRMLFIHGYLHLLGYDHKFSKETKTMFSLQNNLLKELYSKV